MNNKKDSLKFFVLPILSLVLLGVNEFSEVGGGGGVCLEGSWCFLWGPVLLGLLSLISLIIGLKKLFVNDGEKTRTFFVVGGIILAVILLVGFNLYYESIDLP